MDEYTEAIRKFREIYEPLKKKYNLRLHAHFSIYGDGIIEIWEQKGENKGKYILRVREKEDIDCYRLWQQLYQEYTRCRKNRKK